MSAIKSVQTFATYCAPRPMQLGAARAIEEGDAWLEQTRREYERAGRRAAEALGLPPPDGGTFLFFDAAPSFRDGEGSMAFLERCLDAGVLLTPGPASGRDYATFARLSFTVEPLAELEDALDRLASLVRKPR